MAIRRLKEKNDILWKDKVFRQVRRSIIDLKNIQASAIRLRKLIEKGLKAHTV